MRARAQRREKRLTRKAYLEREQQIRAQARKQKRENKEKEAAEKRRRKQEREQAKEDKQNYNTIQYNTIQYNTMLEANPPSGSEIPFAKILKLGTRIWISGGAHRAKMCVSKLFQENPFLRPGLKLANASEDALLKFFAHA